MTNLTTTNNDTAGVVISSPIYHKELVTFGGAGTLLAGTILARDTSTLKLVPYVKGGTTNGNGIPNSVLQNALTATGAGDLTANAIIGGQVRFSKLVIDADGDNSNIDNIVEDELRDFGIVVLDTTQLADLDNQ